jgi:hypothetical protein
MTVCCFDIDKRLSTPSKDLVEDLLRSEKGRENCITWVRLQCCVVFEADGGRTILLPVQTLDSRHVNMLSRMQAVGHKVAAVFKLTVHV